MFGRLSHVQKKVIRGGRGGIRYCPNHTSMEILLIQMIYKSHDRYDWLCAAGSDIRTRTEVFVCFR